MYQKTFHFATVFTTQGKALSNRTQFVELPMCHHYRKECSRWFVVCCLWFAISGFRFMSSSERLVACAQWFAVFVVYVVRVLYAVYVESG